MAKVALRHNGVQRGPRPEFGERTGQAEGLPGYDSEPVVFVQFRLPKSLFGVIKNSKHVAEHDFA